jgi:hypothetical protein
MSCFDGSWTLVDTEATALGCERLLALVGPSEAEVQISRRPAINPMATGKAGGAMPVRPVMQDSA